MQRIWNALNLRTSTTGDVANQAIHLSRQRAQQKLKEGWMPN
jgi:hypothetical protein